MIFFYTNFGGGGRGLQAAPLLFLIPFLLNSGILQLLFGSSIYDDTDDDIQDDSLLSSFILNIILFLIGVSFSLLAIVVYKICLTEANGGGWRGLLRGAFMGGGGGGQRGGGGGRLGIRRTHRKRLGDVATIIQKLPIEIHYTEEELNGMNVVDLKVLLRKGKSKASGGGGNAAANCLEKQDLVEALLAARNTSAMSCSICCEDYESGDALRVLHCGHRFHIECIDKWFLSSTDYSRAVACPVCNTELDRPSA